jgi:HK97 gp10 family phage protein
MQTIEGLDDLDKSIEDLVRKLDGDATEKAVAVAGEVILKEVEIKAPVKTGLLKASLRIGHYRAGSTGRTNKYKATIGVPNSKRFGIMHYAVFLEYGTSKMNAKPFMRPAFDASSDRAVQAFANEIEKALE